MSIPLIDSGDSTWFECDWTDSLPAGVTVSSVVHSVPSPLVKAAESTATPLSYVRVSGAIHGQTYLIEASATLSNTEVLNRQFPLRCFNG